MIITTSLDVHEQLVSEAQALAARLRGRYEPRRGRSVRRLLDDLQTGECLVVSCDRISWHVRGVDSPLFFHPGMSLIRIKRMLRGDNDIMIQACGLRRGDSFLDCTLGLGADSLVASFAVGETGRVSGIESEPVIALLVQEGMRRLNEFKEADEAAGRVEVIAGDHRDLLPAMPDRSFDVVYFDPMFRAGMEESASLKHLRRFANPLPLTPEAVAEARRVARRRVVLKERKQSKEFERLGFSVVRKETSEVAYGVLKV